MTTKRCSVCLAEKPLGAFHRHRAQRLGVRGVCIPCRKSSGEYGRTGVAAQKKRLETYIDRHPERIAKECRVCRSTFIPRRRGGSLQVFCSRVCKNVYYNRRPRAIGRTKAWFAAHPNYLTDRNRKQKVAALDGYGGAICACCAETRIPFLTIDHIGGGGVHHRRAIGANLYVWLVKNSFPSGFRVLCMNCNFAIRFGDPCPHELERKASA